MSKLIAKVTSKERILEEVNLYEEMGSFYSDYKPFAWHDFESSKKSWITDDMDLKDGQIVDSEDYEFVEQILTINGWIDSDVITSKYPVSAKVDKEEYPNDYRQIARKKVNIVTCLNCKTTQVSEKGELCEQCEDKEILDRVKAKAEEKETPEQAAIRFTEKTFAKAHDIINLYNNMIKTFRNGQHDEGYLAMAISAGLCGVYKEKQQDK